MLEARLFGSQLLPRPARVSLLGGQRACSLPTRLPCQPRLRHIPYPVKDSRFPMVDLVYLLDPCAVRDLKVKLVVQVDPSVKLVWIPDDLASEQWRPAMQLVHDQGIRVGACNVSTTVEAFRVNLRPASLREWHQATSESVESSRGAAQSGGSSNVIDLQGLPPPKL